VISLEVALLVPILLVSKSICVWLIGVENPIAQPALI